MKNRKRRFLIRFGLTLFLTIGWAGFGVSGDLELKALEFPGDLLPGVIVETRIEARNTSGHPIVFPRRSDIEIEVFREDGARVAPCSVLVFNDLIEARPADWRGRVLATDWKTEFKKALCFESPGSYTVRYFISAHGPYRNENGEEYSAWEGDVSFSRILEVLQPEGADRDVFDSFDLQELFLGDLSGELLQRFPTSTYAAYVIWERYAQGTAFVDADNEAESTGRGPINEWGPGLCDLKGQIDLTKSWSFSGNKYVLCRDSWMNYFLEHHPDLWFADEIRLKLALDSYLLQDKAACAAGLEALSEHAKPYVAEKARALLEAMQSKNMLPGGPKDLTAAPAPAEPEGKTAQ